MRKALKLCFLSVVVVLVGCSQHYVREDGERLSIYLKAPEARQVELLASFNGFRPLPARHSGNGGWRVSVPVKASFTYFYRIDGRVTLPECRAKESDDFGQYNCVYEKLP